MGFADTTVIIPTLNEEKNIGELLDILSTAYPGIQVIVADDGSSDDTARIVEKQAADNKGIVFLDRGGKSIHGLTASVLDAILECRTPYFVVMDGDLQHPPERVGLLVERLRAGTPLAIGTRIRVASAWGWYRRLMSKVASEMARLVIRMRGGLVINDVMSGFFGGHTQPITDVVAAHPGAFERSGYKVLFDLVRVLPAGTAKAEIPYTFGIRRQGESKIGGRQVIAFLRSLFR